MSQSNPDRSSLVLIFAILIFGISCSAISFVFIRESVERSIMLAAWRVLLAAIILAPAYFQARRRYGDATLIQKVPSTGFYIASAFIITGLLIAVLKPDRPN